MSQSVTDQTCAASPTKWRAAPRADLLWSDFDGELALFHRPSGKTHFVNRATFLLLGEILSEPGDLATTVSKLASTQPGPTSEYFLNEIEALLHRLEQLGLVDRA